MNGRIGFICGFLTKLLIDNIRLTFKRWNSSIWQEDDIIDNILKHSHVNIVVRNSYFDFEDLKNPVKHYYENIIKIPFLIGYHQTRYYTLQENRMFLDDSIYPFANSISDKCYNLNFDNQYELNPQREPNNQKK